MSLTIIWINQQKSREKVKTNFTNDIGKVYSHIGQLILKFVHESYTDDSLFNTIRKNALCIMPKDGIQSFGQLLVDEPCLKREFKKITSEFVNNSVIESAIWLQIDMLKTIFFQANYRWFSKETIPKYLQEYLSNTKHE